MEQRTNHHLLLTRGPNDHSRFKNGETNSLQRIPVSEFLNSIRGTLHLLSNHFDLKVEQWITYNYPIIVCKVSVQLNLIGAPNKPGSEGRTLLCAKFSLCPAALRREAEILFHLEESCSDNCQFFPKVVLFTTFEEEDSRPRYNAPQVAKSAKSGPSGPDLQTSVLLTEWIGSGVPLQEALTDVPCWHTAVQHLAVQLLFVLLYLRRAGVVSRDIKPSNLLWDKEFRALYICDFDLGEVQSAPLVEREGEGQDTGRNTSRFSNADENVRFATAGTPGFVRPRHHIDGHGEELFQELFQDDLFSSAVTLLVITAGIRETDVPALTVSDMLEKALSKFRNEMVALHFNDLIQTMFRMSGHPHFQQNSERAMESDTSISCDLTFLLQHPFFSVS